MTEDILKKIGFYTLEDSRAENVNLTTPLWRCELLVTSRCNFKCPYCRGMKTEDQGDLMYDDALNILNIWGKERLRNIRFSGGEPLLWPFLNDAVKYCKRYLGINRIAISSNGSSGLDKYFELLESGVNDLSISLDSCCSSVGDMLTGGVKAWDRVVENIRELSKYTYVTVGVVLTDDNIHEVEDIIKFAIDLGVSDVRVIPAAQKQNYLPNINLTEDIYKKYPILLYRLRNIVKGKTIRGIDYSDNHKCPLVVDDMAVLNGKHYPCIIYLREQGNAIGNITDDVRQQRYEWYKNHDCYTDRICRENCLDVCVDYNNRVKELNRCL